MKRMFDTAQYEIHGWQSGYIDSDGAFGYRDNTGSLVWDNGAQTGIYAPNPIYKNPFDTGMGYYKVPGKITISFPTALTTKPDHIVFEPYNIKFRNNSMPRVMIRRNFDSKTTLVIAGPTGISLLGAWGSSEKEFAVQDTGETSTNLYNYVKMTKGYIDEPQASEEEGETYLMIPADKFDLVNGKIVLHDDALPETFRYMPTLNLSIIPSEMIA